MIRYILIVLILSSILVADYSCTSAGSDIEQYSEAYDDALEEYESANTKDDKESARDDMESAKSNLDDAVGSALMSCENSNMRIMVQLMNNNKSLEKENKLLRKRVDKLLVQIEIEKIKITYPKFDIAKIIPYIKKQPKLNNPDGWIKIWAKYFLKTRK